MSNLSTTESMLVQSYGMYLDKEQGLEFSTRDSYRRKLVQHFNNPKDTDTPPHFDKAIEKLREYTS